MKKNYRYRTVKDAIIDQKKKEKYKKFRERRRKYEKEYLAKRPELAKRRSQQNALRYCQRIQIPGMKEKLDAQRRERFVRYMKKPENAAKFYKSYHRYKSSEKYKKWSKKYREDWGNIRTRTKQWASIKILSRKDNEILFGCSQVFFREYIAFHFHPHHKTGEKMSWKNRNKWHIDHIVPLSKFDPGNIEDIKKASHFTNLRPLWAKENLNKYNKVIEGLNSDAVVSRSSILKNLKKGMKEYGNKNFITPIMSAADPHDPNKPESPKAARMLIEFLFRN